MKFEYFFQGHLPIIREKRLNLLLSANVIKVKNLCWNFQCYQLLNSDMNKLLDIFLLIPAHHFMYTMSENLE